jgi:hypothetical protein
MLAPVALSRCERRELRVQVGRTGGQPTGVRERCVNSSNFVVPRLVDHGRFELQADLSVTVGLGACLVHE